MGDVGGVLGPALAGALTALVAPSAALVACGALPLAGALVVATLPWPERAPPRRAGARARSPARACRRSRSPRSALSLALGSLDVGAAGAGRGRRARRRRRPCRWPRSRPPAPWCRCGTARAAGGRARGAATWSAAVALAVAFAPVAVGRSPWALAALLMLAGGAVRSGQRGRVRAARPGGARGRRDRGVHMADRGDAIGIAVGAVSAGQFGRRGLAGLGVGVACVGAVMAAAVAVARPGSLGG